MDKIGLKKLLILPLALFVTEILNGIIFIAVCNLTINDTIRFIVLAVFSLLMYYFIGKKIFAKIKDEKFKKDTAIIASILILVSYPLSLFIAFVFRIEMLLNHIAYCSPIANLIAIPFSTFQNDILSVILITIFSPISVVLIWLFSKVKKKAT